MIYLVLILYVIPVLIYALKKNLILSLTVNSIVFVIEIIILQHYNVSFSAYIIVMAIILLMHYKKINFGCKPFNILFVTYLIIVLFVSVANNYRNFNDVFAVFFLYLAFPLIYLYFRAVQKNKVLKINKKQLYHMLTVISAIDVIISIILSRLDSGHQAVINHQPIGGGLAIAFLPILIYLWLEKKRNKKLLYLNTILFGIAVLFSGVRGYALIYYGTFLVYALVNLKSIISKLVDKKYIAGIIILCIITVFIAFGSQITGALGKQLRVNDALGRRHIETEYTLKIIENNSIFKNLFGNGIGKRVKAIDSAYNFDFYANNSLNYYSDYEYEEVQLDESISFHSTWNTIIVDIGFVGLIIFVWFFVYLIVDVLKHKNYRNKEKLIIITYIITFAIALAFRETLFRGILEMTSLYFVLALKDHRKNGEDRDV